LIGIGWLEFFRTRGRVGKRGLIPLRSSHSGLWPPRPWPVLALRIGAHNLEDFAGAIDRKRA
jgi:hypothetical protein